MICVGQDDTAANQSKVNIVRITGRGEGARKGGGYILTEFNRLLKLESSWIRSSGTLTQRT